MNFKQSILTQVFIFLPLLLPHYLSYQYELFILAIVVGQFRNAYVIQLYLQYVVSIDESVLNSE